MFRALIPALVVFASAASAEDVTVAGGVSTLGFNLEATYEVSPSLSARGVVAGGLSFADQFEFETDAGDIYDVDASGSLGGVALMADYYPFDSGFRVSGGVFFSGSELSGTFTGPTETFEGSVDFEDDVAPIITFGYARTLNSGLFLSGEVGLIVSDVTVDSDSTDPNVISDIAEINDDLSSLPGYPYVGVSVGFTF